MFLRIARADVRARSQKDIHPKYKQSHAGQETKD